jgi:centrosomal protein CEP104
MYNNSTPTNSTPPEKKILQKLPYRIISVTSEAESFSVRELLNHTPFSPGWQSSRFCSYPQEILIEFPSLIHLKEIQFLSHQYKIPNKIEIHIDFNNKIQKVGYLSLDSNERSNFQARELKTVYLNYNTQKVLIKFLGCHTNHLNIYAQIGLIALSFLGDFNSFSNENNTNEINHLEDELIYDPVTLKRLKDLNKAKNRAIELEDFEEAKKIKNAIDSLKVFRRIDFIRRTKKYCD